MPIGFETLAHVAIDLSARPYSVIQAEWHTPYVGTFPPLCSHSFESFAVTSAATYMRVFCMDVMTIIRPKLCSKLRACA
ncbi:hypothetical protein [Candidatus Villigracilis saccharophilus]|uniref:hypothetical protein n=1 Tax=Candidatus Villigracilis saccharophilus TaxID=3140684 RepID=UPI0031EBA81C